MRIAFWTYSYLYQDKKSADGNFLANFSLLKELKRQGHEIHWIGHIRPDELAPREEDYNKSCHQFVDHFHRTGWEEQFAATELYKEATHPTREWFTDHVMNGFEYPEVDMVLIQTHNVRGTQYRCAKAISYYTRRGIPTLVMDTDNWAGSCFKNEAFQVNKNNMAVLTRYKTIKFDNQYEWYFGYDRELQREMKPLYWKKRAFVYVGNNYQRRHKIIKFYEDVYAHIYGNFKKDEELRKIVGEVKFKGQIPPVDVVDKIAEYEGCIQIARDDYSRLGQQAPRINECALAGTICFIDHDIKDAKLWVPEDQVVKTGKEAREKLDSIILNREYKQRVQIQRHMIPDVETEVNKLYGIADTIRKTASVR